MKIVIGCDHGGFELKEILKEEILKIGHPVTDVGCFSKESADYPDFGFKASIKVSKGEAERGILICKSGIGMSIAANKVNGIRAALCLNETMAESSRLHNNSNILVLSSNFSSPKEAKSILIKWLETSFEGGRHQRRIDKISEFERNRK